MPEILPQAADAPRDVAAIDIGSNSVRLVLYRLEGRAIWTVFNEKVLAGLGRDLSETGKLSVEGAAQALTALKRFAAVIDGVKPAHVFVAATAAVREATDGQAFCDTVAAETGLKIRVLSGEEEARYAALGVLAGIPDADGVAADLGGSSLELVRLGGGKLERGITLPLGPFALTDPKGAAEARETARLIARQSKASLEKWPGLSKKRAETLPHAAMVLEALIDKLGLKSIVVSAWGVREGLLYEALDADTAADDPLLAGSSALGARQGISPTLPGALRGWIAPVLAGLKPSFNEARDAVLADAACRLADLGARLHPNHRVELAFDQVLRAPVPAQTHAERAWLACAVNARYGGPLATPEPGTVTHLLTEEQRQGARAVGLAIRLACDLSGRSPQLLVNARATVKDGVLLLAAADGYADVLLGEQTRRRGKALAEAMGLKLQIDGRD
ncbi:MAG: Ppx/GppA family phosphatase [Brevundimonas sp.]|nr:MAG: Ppx/GppA family phosphatase [Brevundimonas sp.]